MKRSNIGGGMVLNASMRVVSVLADEAEGRLWVDALRGDCERLRLIYRDVFCSQLEPSAAGQCIRCIEQIDPSRLDVSAYRETKRRLVAACNSLSFVAELWQMGYNLFAHHFVGDPLPNPQIVVAKSMRVESPASDMELAPHES